MNPECISVIACILIIGGLMIYRSTLSNNESKIEDMIIADLEKNFPHSVECQNPVAMKTLLYTELDRKYGYGTYVLHATYFKNKFYYVAHPKEEKYIKKCEMCDYDYE